MNKLQLPIAILAGCALSISATASAQYNSASPVGPPNYRPQGSFAERPLVTAPGDLAVFVGPLANPKFGTGSEAGIHVTHTPAFFLSSDEYVTTLQAGAAYGIVRGFEAGLFTPALTVTPETSAGDLPLFMTLASSQQDVDFGLRTTLLIPLQSTSNWGLNPGLHMLVRFEGGRFDLGAFFPTRFAGDNTAAAFLLPIRMEFGLTDEFFLGLETGVVKLDIADGQNDVFMPLGANAVYSIDAGEHRVDITGRFSWESFLWLNAPEFVEDRVLEEVYTISLGALLHFDLTNPRKKK